MRSRLQNAYCSDSQKVYSSLRVSRRLPKNSPSELEISTVGRPQSQRKIRRHNLCQVENTDESKEPEGDLSECSRVSTADKSRGQKQNRGEARGQLSASVNSDQHSNLTWKGIRNENQAPPRPLESDPLGWSPGELDAP